MRKIYGVVIGLLVILTTASWAFAEDAGGQKAGLPDEASEEQLKPADAAIDQAREALQRFFDVTPEARHSLRRAKRSGLTRQTEREGRGRP